MDSNTHALWTDGRVFWTALGWVANAVFFSRFFVQWWATEKMKQVTVPALFWWLSLAGSLMLLMYAVFYDKHWPIIFAYAFSWIPYIRNLVIHKRYQQSEQQCVSCPELCSPRAKFCPNCGAKLAGSTS